MKLVAGIVRVSDAGSIIQGLVVAGYRLTRLACPVVLSGWKLDAGIGFEPE
jgi:hypothetical protein